MIVGDYTTNHIRDYNNPIGESRTKPTSRMESERDFEHCSSVGVKPSNSKCVVLHRYCEGLRFRSLKLEFQGGGILLTFWISNNTHIMGFPKMRDPHNHGFQMVYISLGDCGYHQLWETST